MGYGLFPQPSDNKARVFDRTAPTSEWDWRMEEVAQSKDIPLARFYAFLTPYDHMTFKRAGIDVYGDLRA